MANPGVFGLLMSSQSPGWWSKGWGLMVLVPVFPSSTFAGVHRERGAFLRGMPLSRDAP